MEIIRVKALPQIVGWRYRPGANGERPCACLCCERGHYGVQKLIRRVVTDEAAGKTSKITMFGRDAPSFERAERRAAKKPRR
jgi:hypothetical protein